MFHADPHAGNVRLVVDAKAPGGAKAVLLDWGLIREINDAERLGLAKALQVRILLLVATTIYYVIKL